MQRIKTRPIAALLAGLLLLAGIPAAMPLQAAAESLDKDALCTLKISVADGLSELKEADFPVYLYRVAAFDADANLKLINDFTKFPEDISTILPFGGQKEPVKEETEQMIALRDKLMTWIRDNAIQYDRKSESGEEQTETVFTDLYTGLYLVVPEENLETAGTGYTMQPLLVSLPNGDHTAEEFWRYDVEVFLKASVDETGSVRIKKTFESCNISLGGADAVFSVTGEKNRKIVYSNIFSLHFDENTDSTQELLITGIPTGAYIKVEEVYSGGAYSCITQNPVVLSEPVSHNKTLIAEFTNKYDETLVQSTSVVNHFYDYDQIYRWVSLPDSQNEPKA